MIPGRTFWRFCLAGGVGFFIEASVLTVLTLQAGWTPWRARIPSFLLAVCATWLMNRSLAFAGRGLERTSVEALSYLAIQTCGAAINMGIFVLCLAHMPALAKAPVIPLAIGSAGGLAFNFLASKAFLYSKVRSAEK